MTELTQKQLQVLLTIQRFIDEKKYPPTLRDLSVACNGVHVSAIRCHLLALVSKGYIERDYGVSRGIRLVAGV